MPWAEAGVGAVATQSLVDPTYGPLGLHSMRLGRSAPDALKALLAGDDGREVCQVAMIDVKGKIAAHTGSECIDAAVEKNDFERASKEYAAAEAYAPQIVEVQFWHAVTLANAHKVDQALPIFRKVFEQEPVWKILVPRLVKTELLPDDKAMIEQIVSQGSRSR